MLLGFPGRFSTLKKSASGVGPSDHTSFYMKGVPVFFFFTGLHKEYHRPTDVVDLINFDGMKKIADMVEEMTRMLWTDEARPEFVKGQNAMMRPGRNDTGSARHGRTAISCSRRPLGRRLTSGM